MKKSRMGLVKQRVRLLLIFVLMTTGAWGLGKVSPGRAASPIYVRPGGDDTLCNGAVDADYSAAAAPNCAVQTIQRGVDLVDPAGEVYVAAGTYAENVTIDKSLLLNTPAAAAITPASGVGVTIQGIGDVTIEGFSITANYGIAPTGNVTNLAVESCTLTNNSQEGIYIGNSAVVTGMTVTATTFYSNSIGIGISGGATVDGLTVQDSVLAYHTAHGIYINNATVTNLTLQNVTLSDNQHEGFHAEDATLGTVSITGGLIRNNSFGIFTRGSTITDFQISDVPIYAHSGSGVTLASGPVDGFTVTGCDFWDNTYEHIDLGLWWGVTEPLTLTNALIQGNNFLPTAGAGIYIKDGTSFGFADLVMQFNRFLVSNIGVHNGPGTTFDAENNWWGCNDGPGAAGCDGFFPLTQMDMVNPWLVLRLNAVPTSVMIGGGTSALTADVQYNSNGQDMSALGAIPDGIPTTFEATLGTVAPATTPLVGGLANSTFTAGPVWGTAVVSATVDNQTVTTTIEIQGYTLFLPLILRNYLAAPDLVVSRIIATSDVITVVIRNEGMVGVVDAFWVDAYVDPDPPPTQVNEIWEFLSDHGAVWGVETPLAVGEELTLTTLASDPWLWPELTDFPGGLPVGTPIYAQVDSANVDTTYGAILETHEILGEPYNNITGPVFSTAGISASGATPSAARHGAGAPSSDLPPRPIAPPWLTVAGEHSPE